MGDRADHLPSVAGLEPMSEPRLKVIPQSTVRHFYEGGLEPLRGERLTSSHPRDVVVRRMLRHSFYRSSHAMRGGTSPVLQGN